MRVKDGNLVINTSIGDAVEMKPYAYQIINDEKVEVVCNYELINNVVGYSFPKGYESSETLVIDPVVVLATFTGSTC